MAGLYPYLTFNGNCEDVFEFYKSVFGSEFSYLGRFKDMPPGEFEVPEAEKEKIMHVSLPIGKDTVLMGSDSSEAFGRVVKKGDNFSLSLNTEDREEADKLFTALVDGGKITMPMASTFWGAYFGMLVDKFGIQWMVSCEEQK